MQKDNGRTEDVGLFNGTPSSFALPNTRFIGFNYPLHAIEIVQKAVTNLVSNGHYIFPNQSSALDARTSTRLSKNVAPPPISVNAEDVVLLAFEPPGVSLFQ